MVRWKGYQLWREKDLPARIVQRGAQGIMEHIINKLQYPQDAQKAGVEGTVVVKFVINKKGQVSETKVLEGPQELTKSAQSVIRGLPGFTPGTQNGKPVNVELVLPIRFALSDD